MNKQHVDAIKDMAFGLSQAITSLASTTLELSEDLDQLTDDCHMYMDRLNEAEKIANDLETRIASLEARMNALYHVLCEGAEALCE